jgi:hypothetical protein
VAKSLEAAAAIEHNRAALIKSANANAAAGKKISGQEIRAIEKDEEERNKLRDLPYMRRMPKGEFCKRFGGKHKTYLEWRDAYGFPWGIPSDDPAGGFDYGSGYVDALGALEWFRNFLAEYRRGKGDPSADKHPRIDRLAEAKAEMAEMQVAVMRGELIHVEDAKKDQNQLIAAVRAFVETLPREAQDVWQDMILELAGGWRIEIDGIDKRNGSPGAPKKPPRGKSSAPAALPRRVRGKVRKARDGAV